MRRCVLAVLAVLGFLLVGAGAAQAADGYWERLARKLPKGSKKRVKLGNQDYREWAIRDRKLSGVDVQTQLDGSLLGNGGNQTTAFRWWATWSRPPKRLEASGSLRLDCEIGATRVQGPASPSFSIAAWMEGAGKSRKGSQKTFSIDTRRKSRGRGPLTLRVPRGRRAGQTFNLVINGSFSAFGIAELPIVYPYRWVEEEDKPELRVRAQLEDRDDQLTPADQATIVLSLANVAEEIDAEDARVEVWFEKKSTQFGGKEGKLPKFRDHLRVGPALRFDSPNMGTRIDRKSIHIAAGGEKEMRLGFHVEDEDNYWVHQVLIQGGGNGRLDSRRKPRRETSYALKGALRVRVRMGDDVLFDKAVDIRRGSKVVGVQYPDLRAAAGKPSDSEGLDYYMHGDPGRSPAGHSAVRAVALRAARHGESGGFLPENDPVRVLSNTANYVFESFMPKYWPETIAGPVEVARELYHYDYGPGVGRYPKGANDKKGFPCIEHALTYNTFARALGFPARGVNAITWWTVPGAGFSFQDASSQIWCRGRWHYRSLFGKKVVTSAHARYGKWMTTFELWVGTAAHRGETTRFEMGGRAMRFSKAWSFWGYGNKARFIKADERPAAASLGLGLGPMVVYSVFSPVAASVKRSGGVVGATQALPLTDEIRRAYALTGAPPNGVPAPSADGAWYPEGLPAFEEDERGMLRRVAAPQTLVVPVDKRPEQLTDQIVLHGTGDGPWRMEVRYIDEKGVHTYGDRSGTVSKGDRVVIETSDLKPEGAPLPWDALDAPPKEPEPRPSFGVGMDTVDAVTARIFGLPAGRVFVSAVVEGGAAHAAGVQWLDVLDQAGDTPIKSGDDLRDFAAKHAVGDKVRLRVLRAGEPTDLTVKLGPRDFRLSRGRVKQDFTFLASTDDFKSVFSHETAFGNRVTALGWDGTHWLAVRTRVWGPSLQLWAFAENAEAMQKRIEDGAAGGYRVTSLSFAAGHASIVMGKIQDWDEQRLLVEPDYKALRAAIKKGWKEKHKVTALAYTGTEWWAVTAKGTAIESQGFVSYKGWDAFVEGIRNAWKAGRHVHHIARNGEQWFGIASRAPEGRNQRFEFAKTGDEVKEKVTAAWKKGWRLGLVYWDGTTWILGLR